MRYEDAFHDYELLDEKYRGKRKKEGVKKSTHKHEYKKYIGKYTYNTGMNTYVPTLKCVLCGKTKIKEMFFTVDEVINGSTHKEILLSLDQIKSEYPDLEVVVLDKLA